MRVEEGREEERRRIREQKKSEIGEVTDGYLLQEVAELVGARDVEAGDRGRDGVEGMVVGAGDGEVTQRRGEIGERLVE